ncbi:hypothetical protein [Mitsuokella jalaludinii]|uniref:hypothetical protein n=1 Tax=Mitsuokella jalaludinii TaxID=187979 RepID=UPI003F998F6F
MTKCIKICLAVLLMTLSFLPMQASAEDRWIKSEVFEDGITYFDSQTATYHPENNTVTGWIGTGGTRPNGALSDMEEVTIYLSTKTYVMNKMLSYNSNIHTFVDISSRISHAEKRLLPDSTAEQLAAYACKKAGAEDVFSVPENRWQWIFSTDVFTNTYARDTLKVDRDKKQVEFYWKRSVAPDGIYRDIIYVRCDLTDNTVSYMDDKQNWQTKLAYPGSEAEKLLDFAKTQL